MLDDLFDIQAGAILPFLLIVIGVVIAVNGSVAGASRPQPAHTTRVAGPPVTMPP